jgi:hypothetical protein
MFIKIKECFVNFFNPQITEDESNAVRRASIQNKNAPLASFAEAFFKDRNFFKKEIVDRRRFDFSVDSLLLLNFYLGSIKSQIKDVKTTDLLILRAGAYLGEVIRCNDRNVEWVWLNYDDAKFITPDFFDNLEHTVGTSAVLFDVSTHDVYFPIEKVKKFYFFGSEHDLHFFAKVVLAAKSNSNAT